jgi:hypothetical protein
MSYVVAHSVYCCPTIDENIADIAVDLHFESDSEVISALLSPVGDAMTCSGLGHVVVSSGCNTRSLVGFNNCAGVVIITLHCLTQAGVTGFACFTCPLNSADPACERHLIFVSAGWIVPDSPVCRSVAEGYGEVVIFIRAITRH